MRQIFFIPSGKFPEITGAHLHMWTDGEGKSIGVVNVDGDAERVIEQLESNGLSWLPNHHYGETIKPEHAQHLSKHGVLATDTTMQAMTKVHSVSGFPHLRPQRF